MRTLTVTLICMILQLKSDAQWFEITPQGLPSAFAFTNASYINADTIFISATDGMLIRTYDGGETYYRDSSIRKGWYNSCPDTPTFHLEAIHFVNDTLGVAAGQDGIFYKTQDGGTDWQCNFLPNSPWVDINDIYFWNSTKGVALCQNCTVLFYTKYGGLITNSWKSKGVQNPYELVTTSYASYIASGNGVYESVDSGSNWQQISFGSDTCFNGIDANGDKVIAVGDNGAILQGENSGQSWRFILDQKFTSYEFKKVAFIDDKNLVFVSQSGSFGDVHLVYTDSSLSKIFKIDTLKETGKIKDISFVDDSTGYIITWEKILKTTNSAGITGIRKQREIKGLSVWPNPSSERIAVKLENRAPNSVNIQIYSLNGKLVYQKDREQRFSVIDISQFANGIYIIQVETPSEVNYGRFIKQ